MDLSALFGRLLLKAHVKSHYRVQGGKVVYIHEYDTKAHGEHPEASLHQRSALGEHAKEGAYIRATDSGDRDAIRKVAQGLGVKVTKERRAGANHHGRQGAYDHLHFASVEDAAKVHAHLQGGPGEAAVKPQDPAIVSQTVNTELASLLDEWLPLAQYDNAKAWTPEALGNTGYSPLLQMKEKAKSMASLAAKIKHQYEAMGDQAEASDWNHVVTHWVQRVEAVAAAMTKNHWLGKHVKAGDYLKDKDGNTWEAGPYSPLGADLVPPGEKHYETLDWQEIAALDLKPTGKNATDEADPPPSNFDTWTPDGSTLVPDAEWTLKNTSAGHDKTYRVEVHKDPISGKFLVLAAWGKTGKPQTSMVKGSFNSAEAAKKSVVAIVNEKSDKGYYFTKIHPHTWSTLHTPIEGAPINPAVPVPAAPPTTPAAPPTQAPAPAPQPASKANPKYAGLDWKQISGDAQTLHSDYLKTKKVTQELVSAAKLAAVVAHHKSQAGMPETEGLPWKSVAAIWAAHAKHLQGLLAAGGA